MSDDEPWNLTDEEYQGHLSQGDEWWKTATPTDRRRLWDATSEEQSCPVADAVTRLAQLKFFEMVKRFPDLKIGDLPCDTPSLFS